MTVKNNQNIFPKVKVAGHVEEVKKALEEI